MTTAESRRAYQRAQRRRARTEANGGIAPVDVHNDSTYINWGCKCQPCVDDHAAVLARARARRFAATATHGGFAPTPTHDASTYGNWGCRCSTCRVGKAAATAAYRARARA